MSDTQSGRALAFYAATVIPGLSWFNAICPAIGAPRDARVMLTAIAGQESDWRARVQGGNGPAHSFWQDERMGAIHGVLTHPDTRRAAALCCARAGVAPDERQVWDLFALPDGDNLACAFARLLLWTDPHPLPRDAGNGWACYLRLWRPGKPRPLAWPGYYAAAQGAG